MNLAVRTLRRVSAGTIGLACGIAIIGSAFAQANSSMPASIIKGSCANPGVVASKLTDLASAPSTAGDHASAKNPVIPVETSVTTVAMKLTDLTDGAHAIDVSLGLACGNLGSQSTNGDVIVGLAGDPTAPASGIAVLHADGDKTHVTIYMAGSQSGTAEDSSDNGSDESSESGN